VADNGLNTLHDWARREYGHQGQLPPSPNHVLRGPIFYIDGQRSISWAMLLDTEGAISGRVTPVPSTVQSGNGFVRLHPSGTQAIGIDTATRIAAKGEGESTVESECLLTGEFAVNPAQHGFTAIDFYFSFPKGFSVRWIAVAQVAR